MVCDVFKLPLLTTYYVRAKINTPSISNGQFYHNTKEHFHFIPKRNLIFVRSNYPAIHFVYIAFIPSLLFVWNLQAFHHKKQSKGTERDGSSLCANEVIQETRRPTAPNSPPAFSMHEEQSLCRQR